ncbi:MAG: SelB C-terminal domain-containing protein, partial [Acidobacteriota bacterium]|nr:SelB C-terminal domain-containing protein [Acidobacteriota bacterium]
KPQTREHFEICRLLGTRQGLVALTKADLVDAETLELVRLEVEDFVRGSFLEGASIQAVSARTGAGLEELRAQLFRAAGAVAGRDTSRYFRLPIDRAFAVKGFGTVVTGTLVSGQVKVGEELELFPSGRRVRVRGVQSAGHSVEQATAGQRTALNLAGVELDEVRRGMVLASPGRFHATKQLDARIQLLPSAHALKNRAQVHFHQGTAETVGEVILLEGAAIAPGKSGFAQLRLREPVLVLAGDRFILRRFSPVTTNGGGVVIDSLAPRHRRRDGSVTSLLETLETGRHEDALGALAEAEPRGLTLEEAVARTTWLEADVRSVAESLEKAGRLKIVSRDPWIMLPAGAAAACAERIRAALDAFHRANPLVAGMPKEELRGRVARGLRPEIFRAVLGEMTNRQEVLVAGDTVMRAGRKITLTPEEERARTQIERAFETAGLAVPSLAELLPRLPVDRKRAEKLVQLLLKQGALVKVSEEMVFHASALGRLREMLAAYKRKQGDRISVAAFKELTGISRKYAIPLLEHLDREKVTRRLGYERVIL